jgi:hypothetical protein
MRKGRIIFFDPAWISNQTSLPPDSSFIRRPEDCLYLHSSCRVMWSPLTGSVCEVASPWWLAQCRLFLSPCLYCGLEGTGQLETQMIIFSYDHSFSCLHPPRRWKTDFSGPRHRWRQLRNLIFFVCLLESEAKTSINHCENPLLPIALWAAPVLTMFLGSAMKATQINLPHLVLTNPDTTCWRLAFFTEVPSHLHSNLMLK